MKFIDLYSGLGGFRIALESLGGECVFSCDYDEKCEYIYNHNHKNSNFKLGDISKKEIQDLIPNNFDVLCAGFSCQPFSIAGKRKGFSDTRGTAFGDIVNIVKKNKPKILFLENVKNILTHDKGNTLKVILCELEKLNYSVFYKVLNTSKHTVIPQNRERAFFVCFDNNVYKNVQFEFPDIVDKTNIITDYLEENVDSKYYYTKEKHSFYDKLKETVKNKNTVYQWRRKYVRENKSNLCPTLTANMGTGGHNVPIILDNKGIRKLTPRECFRLQGFDDTFEFGELSNCHLYKQIGNSVSVPLIKRIWENILKTNKN